jgi:TldD protein
MINKNLNQYLSSLSQYTELRIQENKSLSIVFLNGNLINNSKSITNGVSARVYRNGLWGFASSAEMEEGSIKSILKAAEYNAVFLDGREKKNKLSFEPTYGSFEKDFSTKKSKYTQQQIM